MKVDFIILVYFCIYYKHNKYFIRTTLPSKLVADCAWNSLVAEVILCLALSDSPCRYCGSAVGITNPILPPTNLEAWDFIFEAVISFFSNNTVSAALTSFFSKEF